MLALILGIQQITSLLMLTCFQTSPDPLTFTSPSSISYILCLSPETCSVFPVTLTALDKFRPGPWAITPVLSTGDSALKDLNTSHMTSSSKPPSRSQQTPDPHQHTNDELWTLFTSVFCSPESVTTGVCPVLCTGLDVFLCCCSQPLSLNPVTTYPSSARLGT